MNLKDELINSIMDNFKLSDTIFIRGQVETAVKEIDPSQYLDFFNQLCGDDFQYKNALDRVEIVSKRFKDKIEQPLIEAVKSEAEALSNSLLAKSNSCLEYRYKHKDRYENDEVFFNGMDFKFMRNFKENKPFFTDKEIFVINSLGRDWFRTMSNVENFGNVVKKVEGVLKNANKKDQNLIATNVRKLISQ